MKKCLYVTLQAFYRNNPQLFKSYDFFWLYWQVLRMEKSPNVHCEIFKNKEFENLQSMPK